MREPERDRDHPTRLVCAQSRPHNIRVRARVRAQHLAQQKRDLARSRLLRGRLGGDLLRRR